MEQGSARVMQAKSEQRSLAASGQGLGQRTTILIVLLSVLVFGTFLHIGNLQNDFVFDDTQIIKNNPLVQEPLNVAKIFASNYWHLASDKDPLYRPVTILSYALQNAFTPINPASVLLLNVLIHAAIAVLISCILLRLQLGLRAAAIAGLVFVSMPIHIEVVANGVGRAELLATLFSLCAIDRYLSMVRGLGLESSKNPKPRLGLTLAMIFYLLGVLSKESAITTPALLFLIDQTFCVSGCLKARLQDLTHYVFLLIGAGVYLLIRETVVGLDTPIPHELLRAASSEQRLALGIQTLLRYLYQCLIPSGLLADYHDYRIISLPLISSQESLLALLTFVAVAIATLLSLRSSPTVFIGLTWFFVALLPTSNLLVAIGVIQADRLAFFSSVGIAILISGLLSAMIRKNRLAGLLVLASILFVNSVASINYGSRWRSRQTLWQHVLSHNPGSPDAWRNIGDTYVEQGKYDEALAAYGESKRLRAQHGIFDRAATLLLAKTFHRIGKLEKAAQYHLEILKRNPSHLVSAISLGQLYLEDKRFYNEALRVFEFAAAQHPTNPHAQAHLAEALKRLGRYDEALQTVDLALSYAEQWPYIHLIQAAIYEEMGEHERAKEIRSKVKAE